MAVDFTDSFAQPHAHVADDLLVSAAAGVKLATNLFTNDLAESTLVGSVNLIFFALATDELGGG